MIPEWAVQNLDDGEWRALFGGGALSLGESLVKARLVKQVVAEDLGGGDVEFRAKVLEKGGREFDVAVVFWQEGEQVMVEGECGCGGGAQCGHAAAVLEYFGKATEARVEAAAGGVPMAEEVVGKKTLQLEEDAPELPELPKKEEREARFLLRIERRPSGDRIAWMPEVYAAAYAVYGKERVFLEPSGDLSRGIAKRDRAAEGEALRTLYALDFVPGAEQPPVSLKKVDRPPERGTLWKPNPTEWKHPEIFWQRFRHEGAPALERRGWEVRFAPQVGMEPLVFQTSTWQAEIVEEGAGWFHLSAGFEIDGEDFELQPILAALVANNFMDATEGLPSGQEFMILLPDGRGLALPVGRFRKILKTLGELLEFPFPEGEIKVNKLEAALVAGALAEEGEEDVALDLPPGIVELAERIESIEKIAPTDIPAGLQAELRDYQSEGYSWMQFLAREELHGILADDMGLGKTLQALAHILREIETGQSGELPSMVVAPTSVVVNWQREAAKFAPDLKVLVLQGPERKRRFDDIPGADLVLTSYALLPRDLEDLGQYRYHIFALDEAQHIKNSGAQVSGAVRQIQAKHRLCLSGTPVENNLGELWSLMDFLMPGLLGTRDMFTSHYRTPIEKKDDEEKRAALVKRVGPLILRRTKHDVAKELPPKTEILHSIELNDPQKDLYETVRSTMDKQVRDALALQGTEAQIVFLDALLKLRQICCHPVLLKRDEAHLDSAKFDYCADLLSTLRKGGHRVLLFSQFTSMLDLLEAHLNEEECPYLILTGATKDRQGLVERWQGGEGDVFLISLKAGGTGLTLTGADIVIHYDPWWNPAAENQATDRAYRIGQDKPVFVHKLICQDTVEQRIQQMQTKKDDLASDILSGAATGLSLTPEVMGELLR